MTVTATATEAAPKPAFWYGIPHGYLALDLVPDVEQLHTLIGQLRELPGEQRDEAERVLRFYAGFITLLNRQDAHACLVGLHPDDTGMPKMSVLTVSTVLTPGTNAELAVASMAGSSGGQSGEGILPLELPCGMGFLAERKQRATAPGSAPDAGDEPLQETVWQGTVAVADSDRSSVIVLQMVTPAVEQADDYRDILLGMAHTVTFTDPFAAEPQADTGSENAEQGKITEAIRSDFG